MPQILIFDSTFVAENVHAGEVVDLEQKRNLYRIIIGQNGVSLANDDARLADENRMKTTDITNASKSLQTHLPAGMKLAAFLKLPADAEIDSKITEQAKTVEAMREAEQLRKKAALMEINLPKLPDSLAAVLERTIDHIAADAETQLAGHLAAHQTTDNGEAWLSQGMPFIAEEECPFCGQSLEGLSLIGIFRSLFGASYNRLKVDIASLRATVEQSFGDKASGELTTRIATNATALEFWQRYCVLGLGELQVPENIATALHSLKNAILALLDLKAQAPLEVIDTRSDTGFLESCMQFELVCGRVAMMNTAIHIANATIVAKKAVVADGNLAFAETTLKHLLAIKKRHEPMIVDACNAYCKLEADKANLETQRAAARAKLEAHTKSVVKPYEERINILLDDFNAGFSIAETKHAYPGGQATSSYQLVINETAVEIGDSKTLLHKPSFKNTLSAGDRTTLALAFFLADLERDPSRSSRIVVFDDPFNSQDAFRRLQTAYRIKKAGEQCAQVFVLSHDAGFLRQVWERCPSHSRVAIQITNHRALGSKIGICNLDDACKGRVANEIDDLLQFVNTGAGKARDIVKKMRVVLESYCRSAFPGAFEPGDMLGEIVCKTREGGLSHPLSSFLDDLEQINDYSRDHHHGDDPTDASAGRIDDTEMRGFVRKTLRISHNLQA